LSSLEGWLRESGLTLAADLPVASVTVGDWLAAGAPGHRDRWLDPADQLVAGLSATLKDGRTIVVRPMPRRSVGPDLVALFFGAQHRFGRIDEAWLRVHRTSERLPEGPPFVYPRDPPLSDDERALADGVAAAMKLTI
jgi:FAD/FMN-containing dehydrogenase